MNVQVTAANRQYASMTEKDAWDFLSRQTVLYVATVKPDGRPHVTPIWFVVNDGNIYFRTQDYKVKANNIARNPRVACTIQEGDRYVELKGLMIEGVAKIIRNTANSKRLQEMIVSRYSEMRWKQGEMPEEWARARAKERHVVVEITPLKISSWDNSKLAVIRQK